MAHKVFYIFRHGETDFNREGRWQGAGHNPELNLAGVAQAHLLTEIPRPLGMRIIYSSRCSVPCRRLKLSAVNFIFRYCQ